MALMAAGHGAAAAASLIVGALTAAVSTAFAGDLDVAVGKAAFDRLWVQAPSSTRSADGLGPLFAARSCASCHAKSGGRTTFRLGRDDPAETPGVVIRLGDAGGRPDPVYGAELQSRGVAGAAGEGAPSVKFEAAVAGSSRRPQWRVVDWGYGPPAAATHASPRVAPSLAGLGLLARVDEAAILARADPDDRDGDGISGRAAWLADGSLGRFGWKASEPTLEAQAASAFALDIGLSTTLRPDHAGDCTAAQTACRAAPHGAEVGEVEVGPELMRALVTFLERGLAPTGVGHDADDTAQNARTNVAYRPDVPARGHRLFAASGCAACHAPSLPLTGGGEARAFTDLLLHDMGDGLDDGMGEGAATSREWRTAPLWGLSRALAQGSGLLHDGRAADVAEAIRRHDGEAAGARLRFEELAPKDRTALLDFVSGL